MSITVELGLRIRSIRKSRNLSQEQLAELCNLHPTYIGQLERGEKSATIESLYKISKAFNMSLSKLFEGVGFTECDHDDVPLQIYYQLISLSKTKEQTTCELFQTILRFMQAL